MENAIDNDSRLDGYISPVLTMVVNVLKYPTMNHSKTLGIIYVLLAASFWALGGISGQFLFENYHISASWLVMYRQIFSGLIFLFIALCRGNDLITPLKKDFVRIAIFSVFGVFCCQYGFYWCVELCNAPTATVLQYTCPIVILLWETFRGENDLNGKDCLGVALAITGVFLICTHGDYTTLRLTPLTLFAGALGCFGMAFYKVYPLDLLKKYPIATILGWSQFISGLGMTCLANPFSIAPNWDWKATGAFLFLLLGATVLTFWLDMKGVMLIGPVQSALICSWEPVCSVLGAVFLLHTPLGLIDFLGIGCIVLMVFLLALPKK